jgi:hypothetical protein
VLLFTKYPLGVLVMWKIPSSAVTVCADDVNVTGLVSDQSGRRILVVVVQEDLI